MSKRDGTQFGEVSSASAHQSGGDGHPGGSEGRGVLIAIDGPAGSGKSTLGAALARALGITYFDSGVLYRALTWLALQRSVPVYDERALTSLAERASFGVTRPTVEDGRQATVLADGEDVTWAIRSPEVDHNVSPVSAHAAVRTVITRRLRELAAAGDMVMVGRDIGTVVLPDADLKVYLTASGQERARRRQHELAQRALPADYDFILAEIQRRDDLDSGRAAAPLRPAAGALTLNSDNLTVDQEVAQVLEALKGAGR